MGRSYRSVTPVRLPERVGVTVAAGGYRPGMFIWTKRSGRPGRARFLWWPLVLSVVLMIALNALLR